MKYAKTLILFAIAVMFAGRGSGQTADPVDVLDYDVSLDLSAGRPFGGDATLTLRLVQATPTVSLSLWGTVDTLWVDGTAVQAPLDSIPTAAYAAGDTLTVRVLYRGQGYIESYGWGGFHFDNDMSYNLGVGFNVDPHVMGAAMMPCRDNFYDKATYTLRVKTQPGWTAECGGMLVERTAQADGSERSVWRIAQPTPTYLVSVSQANWQRIQSSVSSLYGTYPLTLGYTTQNGTDVRHAFAELDSVVPMFERCLGPYRWQRIGYIATRKGSMEHVNNIALAKEFMSGTSERGQMTIAHELGHAWFGNLVTCAGEEDMWFNEGGASFCSELAMEANKGRSASNKYYQTNLESVLRTAHITDNGYRALSPMPHQYTYGSTTYDKGALVWHSLRGYLGDSLFYSSMQRLMTQRAFGNVDAATVRDSLSAYSAVDLTDFFAFHVFSPGFVDYHVDLETANCNNEVVSLRIRQQTVGGSDSVLSNRVPVTFYSATGEQCKLWIQFDGAATLTSARLPFIPAFYVLDHDMELSDAATLALFRLGQSNSNNLAHFRYSGALPDSLPLAVEHHWGRPWDLEGTEGVVRPAGRYWVVRGAHDRYESVRGLFHYVREGYSSGNYTHLDRGFYSEPASIDSMVVLYRANSRYPWCAVSHNRTGNENDGYFAVDKLRPGEYTLAVVDTAVLAIGAATAPTGCSLFPNPVIHGRPITLEVPFDDSFTLRIVDERGRRVWQRRGCRNGEAVNPRLGAGTYVVLIENKFVSLQSKLIVL